MPVFLLYHEAIMSPVNAVIPDINPNAMEIPMETSRKSEATRDERIQKRKPPARPSHVFEGLILEEIILLPASCPVTWQKASKVSTWKYRKNWKTYVVLNAKSKNADAIMTYSRNARTETFCLKEMV